MLVFAARAGQSINISDEIRVRVIATESGRVRLGIEAPSEVERRIELEPDDLGTVNKSSETSD